MRNIAACPDDTASQDEGDAKRMFAMHFAVENARIISSTRRSLVVLLGGEAGLRCGEMMALEWTDIDFAKRQLTAARFV